MLVGQTDEVRFRASLHHFIEFCVDQETSSGLVRDSTESGHLKCVKIQAR